MRSSKCIVGLAALLVSLLAAASLATDGEGADPVQVVERLHRTILEAMHEGEEAGYAARYRRLEPVVTESFYFPYIARSVLGAHWRRLEKDDRAAFVKVFTRYTISTYAARFAKFGGERFTTRGVTEQRPDVRVVRTEFTDAKGKVRVFDYQLLRTDERWRIVNVSVDGVSDLSLKRAQYATVLEQSGLDGLMRVLEEKIAAHAAGTASDE